MARPLWKGFLSFGLVAVPCALVPMEEPESEVNFTMLDKHDLARIRYVRVNERTGKEVAWKDIVKGHPVSEKQYAIVTPEDLKQAAPKATKTIEISGFIDRADVPPWYYEKPYAVVPEAHGKKAYHLLAQALAKSGRMAIATVVLHTRQHLAGLIAHDSALVLNTMRFESELRDLSELTGPTGDAKATKQETDMALALIENMTTDWKPAQYQDEYRAALVKWLAQRAKKGARPAAPVKDDEEDAPESYSIMDMLKKSIETQKHSAPRTKRTTTRRKAG